MGNHGSCQSDSSIPVKSIVSAPSNKINTLNNIQASTPTSINNGGLKAGNKSSEKSSRASPDPPAHAPGSEGKTKRRLSSFFGSPKPREGAVLAMAATGTQIMMTTQKITCTNLEKYAKHLVQKSLGGPLPAAVGGGNGITKTTFQNDVFPHNQVAADYLWAFFTNYAEGDEEISVSQFTAAAEKIYAQITDKEQIRLYVQIFGRGSNSIDRGSFRDFLLSAYELDFVAQMITSAAALGSVSIPFVGTGELGPDLAENEWIQGVISSCFHLKEEMSVAFISNWIELNLPRVLIMTHKYVTHQLTTGWAQAQAQVSPPTPDHHLQAPAEDLSLPQTPAGDPFPDDSCLNDSKAQDARAPDEAESGIVPFQIGPIRKRVGVTGIHPVLLWLLGVSLPPPYAGPLERKPEGLHCPFTKFISPQQFLRQVLSREEEVEPWAQLYDSAEQGTSINRFQYNLYNYKGPTLLFVFADNNYTLCLGSDQEWKESSRFWGGEDSFLLQLEPEFRFVERGPKLVYTNFTIRGYPFGIQVGQDTKNISMEIKPDFQVVSFKGIPCRIFRILAFGTGSRQAKSCQAEYKKWENKQCELQRVVKRSKSDWNENPDKYLLELGGATTSYARGNN